MKIYAHDKGIILVGKASEIREKLAEYRRQYELVQDWISEAGR